MEVWTGIILTGVRYTRWERFALRPSNMSRGGGPTRHTHTHTHTHTLPILPILCQRCKTFSRLRLPRLSELFRTQILLCAANYLGVGRLADLHWGLSLNPRHIPQRYFCPQSKLRDACQSRRRPQTSIQDSRCRASQRHRFTAVWRIQRETGISACVSFVNQGERSRPVAMDSSARTAGISTGCEQIQRRLRILDPPEQGLRAGLETPGIRRDRNSSVGKTTKTPRSQTTGSPSSGENFPHHSVQQLYPTGWCHPV